MARKLYYIFLIISSLEGYFSFLIFKEHACGSTAFGLETTHQNQQKKAGNRAYLCEDDVQEI